MPNSAKNAHSKKTSDGDTLSAYQYSPLDLSDKEIRLLDLRAGRFGSDLKGTLHTVRLSDSLDYEALSYTWGPTDDQQTIVLDGNASLQITRNLFRALQRLRYRWEKRILWVDAICINQSDTAERGAQVAFMGNIYATARSCAIWLGDVDEGAILNGRPRFRAAWHFALHNPNLSWYEAEFWRAVWFVRRRNSPAMAYALRTTNPPWHSRAWVWQELCLSKKYSLYFGPKRIRGSAKRDLDNRFVASHMHDYFGDDDTLVIEEFYQQLGGALSFMQRREWNDTLLDAMEMSTNCGASDPRDKIYSLLALISAHEKELIGSSYDISPACVFARATFASMHSSDKFRILSFVTPTNNGMELLPTWALNFHDPSLHHYVHIYGLMRDTDISLSEDCTLLAVAGVSLGSVLAILPFSNKEFSQLLHRKSTDPTMRPRLEELAKSHLRMLGKAGCTDVDNASSHTANQFVGNKLLHERDMSSQSGAALHNIFDAWDGLTAGTVLNIPPRFMREIDTYLHGHATFFTFFTTPNGYFGLAPDTIRTGDRLVVLVLTENKEDEDMLVGSYWEQPTLVLRPKGGQWTFHGLAWMYDRENLPMQRGQQREFVIC